MKTVALLLSAKMAFACIWVLGGSTPFASRVMIDLGSVRSCGAPVRYLGGHGTVVAGAYLDGDGILVLLFLLFLPLRRGLCYGWWGHRRGSRGGGRLRGCRTRSSGRRGRGSLLLVCCGLFLGQDKPGDRYVAPA